MSRMAQDARDQSENNPLQRQARERGGTGPANCTGMRRKARNRLVRIVTDALCERDRLQMRAVDALLSALSRRRRRRTPTSRRSSAKQGR
jgi:hypothetical protein